MLQNAPKICLTSTNDFGHAWYQRLPSGRNALDTHGLLQAPGRGLENWCGENLCEKHD